MTLHSPEWLVALVLIPALLVGAVLAGRLRNRAWQALAAPRLRRTLLRIASPLPRWLALAALLTALACLIGAVSRPQGDTGERTETIHGRNVLIALDLSHSMRVKDVLPSRLDQAKAIALELLDSLPDDRIGVIAFAGTPYLVAPLTVDHAAVRETIQQLDTSTIPTGGSDLASAVSQATGIFQHNGLPSSALIIISDGEEHDGGLTEASIDADRAGIFVFAVGVGTEDGDFIPDPSQAEGEFLDRDRNPVLSCLHQESLRKLATGTGGRYVHATSGAAIGPMVDAAIADLARIEVDARSRTIAIEFFQWLLMPAVLLLMTAIIAGTHWRWSAAPATAAIAALAALTPAGPLHAAPQAGEFSSLAEESSGDHQARYRLAEGTAALAAGDHHSARFALSQALLSDDPGVQAAAHHNLANNLLARGWESLSDGDSYPDGATAPGELRTHVIRKLAAWMKENPGDESLSEGYRLFESVLLDWTDAVRHFDSAAGANPQLAGPEHNRELTVRLLELLRDTLDQKLRQQQEAMPDPDQQGPGEQPGDPQAEPGDSDPQPGQQQPDPRPGDGGDPRQGDDGDDPQDQPRDQQGGGDDQEPPDDRSPREDESPEDQARRLLRENADFEQGPLIRRHRREFQRPAKDW